MQVLVVVAMVAVVGAVSGAAQAASKRAASVEISIEATESKLKGKVSSAKTSCKSGRRVVLRWKNGTNPWQSVADTNSSDTGRWSINAPADVVPPGKYYARVGSKQGCEGAESETIRVG